MTGLGILLVGGAYTLGLWGWCCVKSYNVSFKQLLTTTGKISWPPPPVPPTQIFPNGNTLASGAVGSLKSGLGMA